MTGSGCYSRDTVWWTAELHLVPGARWQSRGSTQPGQVRGGTGGQLTVNTQTVMVLSSVVTSGVCYGWIET